MFTLGVVLTRLQRLATSAISTVVESTLMRLFVLLGVLVTLKTRFVDLCINPLSQVAQTLQNIKAWHAHSITAESSIKHEPTFVKAEVIPLGLQPQTIVPKTLQPANPPVNPKQNLVERTKSGKFARKGTGVVLTPMVRQRQADGKFSKIVASQHHQPASQAFKTGI